MVYAQHRRQALYLREENRTKRHFDTALSKRKRKHCSTIFYVAITVNLRTDNIGRSNRGRCRGSIRVRKHRKCSTTKPELPRSHPKTSGRRKSKHCRYRSRDIATKTRILTNNNKSQFRILIPLPQRSKGTLSSRLSFSSPYPFFSSPFTSLRGTRVSVAPAFPLSPPKTPP